MRPPEPGLAAAVAGWQVDSKLDPKWVATRVHELLLDTFEELDRRYVFLWPPEVSVKKGYGRCWTVCAESGPYDWPFAVANCPAVRDQPLVLAEPYNGFVLGFYQK